MNPLLFHYKVLFTIKKEMENGRKQIDFCGFAIVLYYFAMNPMIMENTYEGQDRNRTFFVV